VDTGALDYLVANPHSAVDAARDQGSNDANLCVATTRSDCPDPFLTMGETKQGMSKEERDKILAENRKTLEASNQCSSKSWANTPACGRSQRCPQFEAELLSGSEAKP
jgi:hypothetical protein